MRGKPQSVYWFHEGDEVPTRYESHRALANRLGCETVMVFYYLSRDVNGDKAKDEYLQGNRRGKPKPVAYQGMEYASIEDFRRAHNVGNKKARQMLGLSPVVARPMIKNRYRNKLDAIQKLAIKAKSSIE